MNGSCDIPVEKKNVIRADIVHLTPNGLVPQAVFRLLSFRHISRNRFFFLFVCLFVCVLLLFF